MPCCDLRCYPRSVAKGGYAEGNERRDVEGIRLVKAQKKLKLSQPEVSLGRKDTPLSWRQAKKKNERKTEEKGSIYLRWPKESFLFDSEGRNADSPHST